MKKSQIAFILVLSMLVMLLGGCEAAEQGGTSGPDGSEPIDDLLVLQDAPDLPRPWWGDDVGGRCMYTQEDVANGVLGEAPVLNSLIDSPIQDARCFVYAQKLEPDGTLGPLARSLAVKDGDVYQVYMYIQNDNPDTISEGTRAALSIPLVSEDGLIRLAGFIYSDNAVMQEVWSTLVLSGENDFRIDYVYGSARLTNTAHVDGLELDDALVTKAASENGVAIGYEEMDGNLPGGEDYYALVSVQIKIVDIDTSLIAET